MERRHDAQIGRLGLGPLADLPRNESADESDALQTLRDTARAPRARQRLECVRLQRRFPRRSRPLENEGFTENRPRMIPGSSANPGKADESPVANSH